MPTTALSHNHSTLIDSFEDRFEKWYGEGHMLFACHAVFPIMVSPDLLYQIWYNFRHYSDREGDPEKMAAEVVSDFLHSGLCKLVRHNLYSVEDEIRVYLLQKLMEDSRFGELRVQQLAHFLKSYLADPASLHMRKHTRQIHEWIIGATLDPTAAARSVSEGLMNAFQQNNLREKLRLFHIMSSLSHHSSAFDELLQYAGEAAETIQREDENSILLPAISLEDSPGIDNWVKMPMTDELRGKIGRKREKKTNPEVLKRIEECKGNGGTFLNLSGFGLASLPPELWELKELEWLDLSDNRFAQFPKGLRHFLNLTQLSLKNNNIKILDLSLLESPGLTSLDISNNKISFIPEHICQLKKLSFLYAENNAISTVPGGMGKLFFEHISLRNNRISSIPFGWENVFEYWIMSSEDLVDSFDLRGNKFDGLIEGIRNPEEAISFCLNYSKARLKQDKPESNTKIQTLMVGIDTYLDPQVTDLFGAEAEIQLLADKLARYLPGEKLNQHIQIGLEFCTKEKIIESLEGLKFKKGDQFLFVFAGHGAQQLAPKALQPYYPDGKMGGLMCSDSKFGESMLYGIELEAILSSIHAKGVEITIITDSSYCSSLWSSVERIQRSGGKVFDEKYKISNEEFSFAHDIKGNELYQRYANASFGEGLLPQKPGITHISAARWNEQSGTIKEGKLDIGACNYELFQALDRVPRGASFAEMMDRISVKVNLLRHSQHPELIALGDASKYRSFLGEFVHKDDGGYSVFYDATLGAWVVNIGAVHGLPTDGEGDIIFRLFDEFHREADEAELALAEVKVKAVYGTVSVLEGLKDIDPDVIFKAFIKEMPLRKIWVFDNKMQIHLKPKKPLKTIRDAWDYEYIDDVTDAEIDIEGDIITHRAIGNSFRLTAPFHIGDAFTEGDDNRQASEMIARLYHWERVMNYESETTWENEKDIVVSIETYAADEDRFVNEITLGDEDEIIWPSDDEEMGLIISLDNVTENELYVAVLILLGNGAIHAVAEKAMFMSPAESIEIRDFYLNPRDLAYGSTGMLRFKVLTANEPFSVESLVQDGMLFNDLFPTQ